MAINLNNKKIILPTTSVNVEFWAKKTRNKLSTVQPADYWAFYQNVSQFLPQYIEKLYEQCPLKCPLAGVLSSLSPLPIKVAMDSGLVKLFDKLIEILVNVGWISSIYVDRAQTDYLDMTKNEKFTNIVHKLEIIKDQLVIFYMKILDNPHINLMWSSEAVFDFIKSECKIRI